MSKVGWPTKIEDIPAGVADRWVRDDRTGRLYPYASYMMDENGNPQDGLEHLLEIEVPQEKKMVQSAQETEEGSGKSFVCPECGKEFKTEQGRDNHVAKIHVESATV